MSGESPDVKEMLATVVRAFVDQPDEVVVSCVRKQDSTVLELKVAPGDLGRVIGRQGRTARALRALVSLTGEKLNERLHLQILD
jgi:predicted RNA-binding protein YlqC (UPF0109 family)